MFIVLKMDKKQGNIVVSRKMVLEKLLEIFYLFREGITKLC